MSRFHFRIPFGSGISSFTFGTHLKFFSEFGDLVKEYVVTVSECGLNCEIKVSAVWQHTSTQADCCHVHSTLWLSTCRPTVRTVSSIYKCVVCSLSVCIPQSGRVPSAQLSMLITAKRVYVTISRQHHYTHTDRSI